MPSLPLPGPRPRAGRRPSPRPSRPVLAAALLLCAALPAAGEEFRREAYFDSPQILYPGTDYDPAIPTFSAAMGFAPGEWFTSPAQAELYLSALDRASDRVRLTTYGRTYEGRPLLLATISSPANLARLDATRQDLARLRKGAGDADIDRVARSAPVIVWLGYSIHGDEHSGTEAAMLTAYHLAADRSEETRRWLDETVVLIDPMQNPDGRARFLRWEEATIARDPSGRPRPDPDPAAAEHTQPWPGGRFNHYLFDLNRDWFLVTQAETRARVAALLDWSPQVFADLHEMETDSTYYFAPPTTPINPLIPDSVRRWWETFGAGNARMFDRFGIDYYTRERFDAFYPGYGDSFPTLSGAVGMTYEQASAQGLAQLRRDGAVLTLRVAAWHHFLASLATIRTAADHREACLRDFGRTFQAASKPEQGAPREIWVQPAPGGDLSELADHLTALGVQVLYPAGRVSNESLRPIVEGASPPETLDPLGLLVPLAQPQRRLVQALFEREIPMDESFLREEEEKRRRREPGGFYDVTAWALPLAYGVDAWWADKPSEGPTSSQRLHPPEGVGGVSPAIAYLLRYDGNAPARALVDLLAASPPLRVQLALREFKAGGTTFDRGTIVLKASGNPADLADRLSQLGQRRHVLFTGVPSGLTEEGIDLGSSQVVSLRLPRIGLLYGDPASPTSAGWLSYLFEQKLGLDYTRLLPETLADVRLADFDVLVFPDTDPLGSAYRERLGKEGIDRLRRWVEAGGTFVGIGGGAAFAASEEVGWTTARPVTQHDLADKVEGAASRKRPEEGEEAEPSLTVEDLPDPTPGAIARVILDPRHFLTVGYGERLAVPIGTRLAFTAPRRGRVVARFDDAEKLRIAGFMWDETRRAFSGQAYVVSDRLGDGKLILFAGDPSFRAYWPNLHRLLLNALIVAPAI